jgi:hypothetical protein
MTFGTCTSCPTRDTGGTHGDRPPLHQRPDQELIVLSNGKQENPGPMQTALATSPYIAHKPRRAVIEANWPQEITALFGRAS